MLEAVIFGIFTGVMFFNQMWAVSTDETVCWIDFSSLSLSFRCWCGIVHAVDNCFNYKGNYVRFRVCVCTYVGVCVCGCVCPRSGWSSTKFLKGLRQGTVD